MPWGIRWLVVRLLAMLLLPGAGAAAPVLYFSDLDWGPKTGWEGSSVRGAAVTVWGQNLGASRGSSYVTVNGARLTADEDYAEWGAPGPARGLGSITFWVSASAQDGAGVITVTVDSQTSNALPFTVLNGAIYFISPSGSNANNGLYSTSRGSGSGPFRDIYMFNPGLDAMHGDGARNPSGDGQYIVYVRAGTYSTTDVDGSLVALRGPYGGPSRRKALIGYPGETPVLNAAGANRGVVWTANYSPYGRLDYFTFARLSVVNGTWAFGLWGDYNRVVGNQMKDMNENAWTGVVMVDNSQNTAIYGNFFDHCGYDSYKHNIYIKTHRDYIGGDKSVDHTDIGWNEFANAWAGTDARGGVIFVSRESGTANKYTGDTRIHDNYFRDGNMDFIYIGDSVPIGDVYVYNNVFRGGTSTNGGLTMYDGTTNAYFYNNTFYRIGPPNQAMAWGTGSARLVFRNNIWHAHPGQTFFNLEAWRGALLNSDHDLFHDPGNHNAIASGPGITVTNPIRGDPMFVNAAGNNLHLLPGSPAIDAGTASVGSAAPRDFDGVPRPQGAANDPGAYEYGAGSGSAVDVTLTPVAVTLQAGGSQQFTATVTGTSDTAVIWGMDPIVGTLSAGLYEAPASVTAQQTVVITAVSVADPSRWAGAAVTLQPTPPVNQGVGYRFVPVTPCRVADTRSAPGPFGGPRMNAGSRSFAIPSSACNIPATATAYSLNVTVVPAGALSYLTLYPAGVAAPGVSTLNSFDGRVKANAAIVPAGAGGSVQVLVTNPADVILDINGYFATEAAAGSNGLLFYPVAACRIADSRNPSGVFGGPALGAGQSRTWPVPASGCAIGASARAYSLNFTAVPKGSLGYLTTWPSGATQPWVSTLNSLPGVVVANAAIVPAGQAGAISTFVTNETDVVIDINGYFAPPGGTGGLSFYPLAPCRISDTRNPAGAFGGPSIAGGRTRIYAVPASSCNVPVTARAYSLNVTVVPQSALSYLTIWPAGAAQPFVSTLNSPDGSVVANAAIVPASANGSISAFVTNTTDLVLDINGYFAP